MQCHQRRRTRGIHRHRRALQANTYATARRPTLSVEPRSRSAPGHLTLAPIQPWNTPGRYARLQSPQRGGSMLSAQRRWRQALLRVHRSLFKVRSKLGVKTGSIRQNPPHRVYGLPTASGSGVKQAPPSNRDPPGTPNRVTAVCHQLPQRGESTPDSGAHPPPAVGPGKISSLQSLVCLSDLRRDLDEVFGCCS